MTQRAIAISTCVKTLAAGCAFAILAVPAHSQVNKTDPNMGDVVSAPLDDLNLNSRDIPEPLVKAQRDVYAHEDHSTCNAIVAEIAQLDTILGADYDIAETNGRGLSVGGVAQSIVRSFVPFRGVIREVSGAESRQRAAELAVTSGMVRRAYLKGLGQGRDCAYPARPHENRVALTVDETPEE